MQSYTTRQSIRSYPNSVKQAICATALYLACEAVRKGRLTFTYMGRLFTLTAVSEREYYESMRESASMTESQSLHDRV